MTKFEQFQVNWNYRWNLLLAVRYYNDRAKTFTKFNGTSNHEAMIKFCRMATDVQKKTNNGW